MTCRKTKLEWVEVPLTSRSANLDLRAVSDGDFCHLFVAHGGVALRSVALRGIALRALALGSCSLPCRGCTGRVFRGLSRTGRMLGRIRNLLDVRRGRSQWGVS